MTIRFNTPPQPQYVNLDTLAAGMCFEEAGETMMVLMRNITVFNAATSGRIPCVQLRTGEVYVLARDTQVRKLELEVTSRKFV